MSSNTDKKIRKTLLTPCRRQGLKRKSLDITPNTSFDFSNFRSPCTPNTSVNTSLDECDTTNTTPIRHRVQRSLNQSIMKKPKVRPPAVDNVSTPESQKNVSVTVPHLEEKQESNNNDYEEDKGNSDSSLEEDQENIDSLIEKITRRITEKKTQIEKLELDSKNVKQHNLADLNTLINKWRQGCQTALKDLSLEYQNLDPNLNMPVLLKKLNIPYELVHYSETQMDFQN